MTRAVHQHRQLLQSADVDQQRRRVDVAEIVLAPGDLAVRLLERHHRLAAAADRHDHRVAKRDRARRVAVHQPRAAMIGPELLRPQQLARLLLQALQPAGDAGREHAVADDERRGVRTVAHLAARRSETSSAWRVPTASVPVSAFAASTTSSRGLPYIV